MLIPKFRTQMKHDKSHYYWLAVCDQCNREWLIPRRSDVNKCCSKPKYTKGRSNFRDWSGQTVGYLLILSQAGTNDSGLIIWNALCTYENHNVITQVTSDVLRKGHTVSCGCYARKQTRLRALNKYKGEI